MRLRHITALCRPEQQQKLETIFHQQQVIARGMVAARRLADTPSDRCTPQFVVEEAKKLMPAWEAAIREADRYGQWERLDALVDAALKTAGLTRQDAWNIH